MTSQLAEPPWPAAQKRAPVAWVAAGLPGHPSLTHGRQPGHLAVADGQEADHKTPQQALRLSVAESAACLTPVWQSQPCQSAAAAAQGASGYEDGGSRDQPSLLWHHVNKCRQAAAACALCPLCLWAWASEVCAEERRSQKCQDCCCGSAHCAAICAGLAAASGDSQLVVSYAERVGPAAPAVPKTSWQQSS